MRKAFPTIAACDFGSSKVAILICEITPSGLEVAGFGQAHSRGVRKGVVVNLDSTVEALQEAIHEAQSLSQVDIDFLVCGVTGTHIQCLPSNGMIPVREREIRQLDVQKVLETASTVSLPLDREVIQVVPQEYIVDGQDGIHQPVGMYGRRLEARVQIVTGAVTTLQNIRRCLQKADLDADAFISHPLASARAVVGAQEREAGVCVVDIGAASTDMVVFQDGVLSWLQSISIGGMHLTNDLAVGLKTSLNDAEEIKHRYGCVLQPDPYEKVEIVGLAGAEMRQIDRRLITTILQPRVEEILQLVRNELAKRGVDESLPSGIVLTGGSSLLKGILDVSHSVFSLPCRLGRPERLGGLSEMISTPVYSSLVGLIQLGFEQSEDLKYMASVYQKKGVKKFQAQVFRWMKDFF